MLEPDIWDNQELSTKIIRESKHLKETKTMIESVEKKLGEAQIGCELYMIGESEVIKETEKIYATILEMLETLETQIMLNGKYDANNCILSIQSGTGGLDAQDWAEMLLRMYLRYIEKKGFRYKILDILEDTEAGIKHASVYVEGEYAFGNLKSEDGVHRLVRISPYNSSGKRQTSFASVEVMPEFDEVTDIEVNQEDLRIDTYRSGGAGGQHVNTTDSAVRITHIPTGIVVQCQNERSQLYNRDTAMKLLLSKLYERMLEEEKEKIDDIKGESKSIAWGSQIRSYVLNPYNLVKDHRTKVENANVQKVLDGDIDMFVKEYLRTNE